VTLLGGLTRNYRDILTWMDTASPASPDTFYRANQPRVGLYDSASDSGQVALATGVMTAVRMKLFAGDVITNVSVRSGQTAAGTPTNYWVALYSNAGTPALLSQSADQTTTAWNANTTKTLALGTPQTISKTDFYWVAINVTATTPPSLIGTCHVAPIVTGEANLSVSSGSSLTGTATATLASPTVKTFVPYVVLT
jgi:hypothetical protein